MQERRVDVVAAGAAGNGPTNDSRARRRSSRDVGLPEARWRWGRRSIFVPSASVAVGSEAETDAHVQPDSQCAFGEEEALEHISPAGLVARARRDVVLADERDDGARDQVPLGADSDGDHRLYVQQNLVTVLGESLVIVQLEGNAREAYDGIRELLCEFIRVLRARGCGKQREYRREDNRCPRPGGGQGPIMSLP